ncbi:MAG: M20 family metallopeptidase [Anaerolineae bacterium]|jgi:amidohydrolase
MDKLAALKQRVVDEVEAHRAALIKVSDTIHAHPELGFEEYQATALLTGLLEDGGYSVQRGVVGLETAFVATARGKEPGPTIAILAEYDALEGLGHACGHNIIGTAAVGAGLALQAVLPELVGQVQVIGTPAEEGGGGKAIMVDAGVFAEVEAAMMIHPSGRNLLGRSALTAIPVTIEFYGKPAHAAAEPDEGINALEAMILTFNAINALRQHVRDDVRIHGIIRHGGDAPNIVPEYTMGEWIVRAADTPYAIEILDKVRACAEGAALATGARLEFRQSGPRYDARLPNPTLVALFRQNLLALGLEVEMATGDERMGSSDIGNVSQVVPAIHPYIAIGPEEIGGHTVEFREAAVSAAGHEGLIHAAQALAMTAVDLLAEPTNLTEAKRSFAQQKADVL